MKDTKTEKLCQIVKFISLKYDLEQHKREIDDLKEELRKLKEQKLDNKLKDLTRDHLDEHLTNGKPYILNYSDKNTSIRFQLILLILLRLLYIGYLQRNVFLLNNYCNDMG